MCDPRGSTSLSCDAGGKCVCKDGYFGIKCDPPGKQTILDLHF